LIGRIEMTRTPHSDNPEAMHPARVGARITALRTAHGLTQTECWRACDIHASAWGQYEKGARAVPPAAAARMAELFGVLLDFIYLGDNRHLPADIAARLSALRTL
jgi:transcriptional regulator with XRE-family HTH domain